MSLHAGTTLGELARDKALADKFIESVLANGARSAMHRTIGDRTPTAYDKAAVMAEGIGIGVRNTLEAANRAALAQAPSATSHPEFDVGFNAGRESRLPDRDELVERIALTLDSRYPETMLIMAQKCVDDVILAQDPRP